jgi:hypothetical protein
MGLRLIKPAALFLLLLVSSLLGVACGSDDGDDEAATLPKAQYIKQADKICEKIEKKQLDLVNTSKKDFKPAPGSSPEEALIEYAAIPTLNQQLKELEALPDPEQDAAKAKAFLRAFEEGIKETEEDPKSLLSASTNPFVEAEELAAKFGFKACGGP